MANHTPKLFRSISLCFGEKKVMISSDEFGKCLSSFYLYYLRISLKQLYSNSNCIIYKR